MVRRSRRNRGERIDETNEEIPGASHSVVENADPAIQGVDQPAENSEEADLSVLRNDLVGQRIVVEDDAQPDSVLQTLLADMLKEQKDARDQSRAQIEILMRIQTDSQRQLAQLTQTLNTMARSQRTHGAAASPMPESYFSAAHRAGRNGRSVPGGGGVRSDGQYNFPGSNSPFVFDTSSPPPEIGTVPRPLYRPPEAGSQSTPERAGSNVDAGSGMSVAPSMRLRDAEMTLGLNSPYPLCPAYTPDGSISPNRFVQAFNEAIVGLVLTELDCVRWFRRLVWMNTP